MLRCFFVAHHRASCGVWAAATRRLAGSQIPAKAPAMKESPLSPSAGVIGNSNGWLPALPKPAGRFGSGEEVGMIADPTDIVSNRDCRCELAHVHAASGCAALSVILMDVLGCSLQVVCEAMDYSLPVVKP